MTTHVYIIRHGEALSAAQRTMGNTRLSPLGVKQAERLRDRLAATKEDIKLEVRDKSFVGLVVDADRVTIEAKNPLARPTMRSQSSIW